LASHPTASPITPIAIKHNPIHLPVLRNHLSIVSFIRVSFLFF
jgi:hypothetical protein